MSENLTIQLGWGPRVETAPECAARLEASIRDIPAQRDSFSEWLVMPDGGASGPSDLLPLPADLDGLTDLVHGSRLKDDRGEVMEGSGFAFSLARHHNDRPVMYRVRCAADRVRPGNHVQFDFPHPDYSDSAVATAETVTADFTALVLAWRPAYAAVSTYSFRKAQKIRRRSNEFPVGWLTYLSDEMRFDRSALRDFVDVQPLADGSILTLGGTPDEPSLADALTVREALGYVAS